MKNKIPSSLVALVIVIAAFAGLFIWGDWNMAPELLRLERILDLLQKDPALLWRQRAGLDTRFEGAMVLTDKDGFRKSATGAAPPDSGTSVLCLGASPTFGYGIEYNQTYPKIAENILNETGTPTRIFNAGQIGYSSFQGLALFKKYIDQWAPDVVSVSYVVNDIDRLRFFFTNGKDDVSTQLPPQSAIKRSNFISRFRPSRFLLRHQRRVLSKLAGQAVYRGAYEQAHVRVMPEDYEKNLLQFVELCRDKNIHLVFIKMPFRLPRPIPPRPDGVQGLLDRAETLLEKGELNAALSHVDTALDADPFTSRSDYLKGRILEKMGEKTKARSHFVLAMKHLIYDCARDSWKYNEIMETVAAKTGTTLVNAAPRLGGDSADMELFVPNDYIHPNALGHEIIGHCLAKAIPRVISGDETGFVQTCD